jgi:peptidoglycan/xylan/chitin deacetylase (PgdA/CDA1 family)
MFTEERGSTAFIIPTIYFHRVVHEDDHYTNYPPAQFRSFVELVAKRYRAYTCAEALGYLARGDRPPGRPIIITIDDCYKDLLEVAIPTLTEYGLRAVLFCISAYIGRKAAWNPRLAHCAEHLSATDLQSLVELGFEVGSHSATHRQLAGLCRQERFLEIQASKREIEDRIGAAVQSFAYPYGVFDTLAEKDVSLTYRMGWSTLKARDVDWNTRRSALRRFYLDRLQEPESLLAAYEEYWRLACDADA